ncbi:MAG: hypothetical protein EOO79_05665, partial [Oxalobacteraceae bacterium]
MRRKRLMRCWPQGSWPKSRCRLVSHGRRMARHPLIQHEPRAPHPTMIRSLLYAPANRPELVAKFPRFRADCCVIDLEDGTPEAEKASARSLLADTVMQVRAAGLSGLLAVRVNVPASPHYVADIEAALACDIDAIVIPKL